MNAKETLREFSFNSLNGAINIGHRLAYLAGELGFNSLNGAINTK